MDDIDDIISINSSYSSHDDDGDNDPVLLSVARRIARIMTDSSNNNNNTTSMKKLFTILLECNDDIKYKHNILIQNKINSIAKDLEEEMDMFIKHCKPIIDQNIPIPVLVREKSNELLLEDAVAVEEEEEDEEKITPSKFSRKIKHFLLDLLNHQLYDDWDDYRGLDCDRDTEHELENVLRIYPDVLKYSPEIFGCHSIKYATFIPMVAQLRMEFSKNLDRRVEYLGFPRALISLVSRRPGKQDDHQLLDHRIATTMKRLKVMGLFKKGDIENQQLLHFFAICVGDDANSFSSEVFQFLVTWDPVQLITANDDHTRQLPLHHAAYHCSLDYFQAVFEAGLRYFPRKMGIYILFQKRRWRYTPFDRACWRYGREKVLKVIESTLIKCSANPYDTAEVLFIAATNEDISIDGIYFLLRRTPDVVQKLSRSNIAIYIEERDVDIIDTIDIVIKEEKEFQEILDLEKHIDIYITSHDDYWYAQYDDDNRKRIRDDSNNISGHDHDYGNKKSRRT
ncbi:hypothetical protein FRACYDRAFT_235135 [Fragilariopsis cylindrus CCMP1102]|uniref:Uncharacterized protein n=1 Tax=Fragilariopsis cylindrus CCMP1102 TaxID=635003 RepID=A0A1E7FTM1_9STRA|nr:hypothetical protein FRACYDRAFT_235135 [Fragilariopsis cylindrus CCMP1102]|eukprot:OEU21508.1 hypothetical protein FRACYDRAFT_235135 [Fragilariopsis cylindrus CCMP1102]